MFQTLARVNAALAGVQSSLPPTAKVTANRLTFAAFPIMGYSLTSDTVPQTRLWEIATYDLKPRLNRAAGVSTVIVQGGQEPEFEVKPDPAKLLQTSITVPTLLDAIGRSNLDRFARAVRAQPPARAQPRQRPGAHRERHLQHRREDDGARRADPHRRHRRRVAVGQAGLHDRHGEHEAGGAALRDAPARQQHRGRRRRRARADRPDPRQPAEGRGTDPLLRSVGDRRRLDHERARRGADRPRAGVAHHGAVPARLGHLARRRPRHPRHARGHLHRAARARRELQPDDARRAGGRRRPGDRRCDRGRGEHRHAPRLGADAGGGDPQRPQGDPGSARRVHDHADRRVPAAHLDDGRHRDVLPRARDHGRHGAADLARARADVDADAQPLFHPPARVGRRRRPRQRAATSDGLLRARAEDDARAAAGVRARGSGAYRRIVLVLQRARLRPAAGDGRGRIHRRLHHARRIVARRDEPRDHPGRADSARDAGGGEHVASHGHAARPGDRDRGQHRRHLGEAEAQPQPLWRRGDLGGPRQDQQPGADARRGVRAAPAGHDRRPHERSGAGRDQAVLRGSGAAQAVGAARRRGDQEDPGRRGRARRHREHDQRAGDAVHRQPGRSPPAPGSRRRRSSSTSARSCRASPRRRPSS